MLAVRALGREFTARLLPTLARGVASWSKFDPAAMSGSIPAQVSNLGALRRRRRRRRHRRRYRRPCPCTPARSSADAVSPLDSSRSVWRVGDH